MLKFIAAMAFLGSAAALGEPTMAQTPATAKAGGVITAVNGSEVDITQQDGSKLAFELSDKTGVALVSKIAIDAIKPGSFVGTGAMPDAKGALTAMEVTVFPEALRGVGEGNRPWDAGPTSSMTNGTVSTVVGTSNRTMTVTYKGGEKTVIIPDNVPVVTFETGDKSLLVPGANGVVRGHKGDDGKIVAAFVSVGKDGLVPPM